MEVHSRGALWSFLVEVHSECAAEWRCTVKEHCRRAYWRFLLKVHSGGVKWEVHSGGALLRGIVRGAHWRYTAEVLI